MCRAAGAVKFTDDDGKPELAVGEFTQSHDVVTGTFLAETGDHRFLAGQVKGDELYLSTFDGAHAFLYKAKVESDGAPSQATSGWEPPFTNAGRAGATRTPPCPTPTRSPPCAPAPNNSNSPSLISAARRSARGFSRQGDDVALAGSWCPNCHDEAAFLEPLYREYRGKGLEIVSLMFEHFGDFPQAVEATERFRRHYGIEYTTLIAGISNKDEASKRLPMLDRVYAFPTTLFVDRKGVVRKIHTPAFPVPPPDEHYTQFAAEVRATLDQLLAET